MTSPSALTVREVATEVRRSTCTVRDWIARGYLPAMQFNGGPFVVMREDLDEFLRRHLRDTRRRSVLRREKAAPARFPREVGR